VVGIESRGYYFGISLADRLGVAFVPIRKKGKLPSKTVTMEFGKEYGWVNLAFFLEKYVIRTHLGSLYYVQEEM
jgi:adenine phosphoribosyltransferase